MDKKAINKVNSNYLYTDNNVYIYKDNEQIIEKESLEDNKNMILSTNINKSSLMSRSIYDSVDTRVTGTLDYDTIFTEMAKRFNKAPKIEHKCHNCGGTLEIKPNQGIFTCPYCRSVYAIGTNRINDVV